MKPLPASSPPSPLGPFAHHAPGQPAPKHEWLGGCSKSRRGCRSVLSIAGHDLEGAGQFSRAWPHEDQRQGLGAPGASSTGTHGGTEQEAQGRGTVPGPRAHAEMLQHFGRDGAKLLGPWGRKTVLGLEGMARRTSSSIQPRGIASATVSSGALWVPLDLGCAVRWAGSCPCCCRWAMGFSVGWRCCGRCRAGDTWGFGALLLPGRIAGCPSLRLAERLTNKIPRIPSKPLFLPLQMFCQSPLSSCPF